MTVTDGPGLVAAVAALPAGDSIEITIDDSFVPLTATASLALAANTTVTIKGANPAPLTDLPLDPALTGAHIVVAGAAGSRIVFEDLAFTGQNTIDAEGTRTGNVSGGGLSVSGTVLELNNTTFTGITGGTTVSLGGGVGSVTISGSSFIGNQPNLGPAVWLNSDTGPLTISDSSFIHNDAVWSGYRGGAIAVPGGSSAVLIERSVFRANTSPLRGGAISLDGYSGSLTVNDSVFISNQVSPCPASPPAGVSQGDGGAIAIVSNPAQPGTLTIQRSTFSGNSACDEGGAILVQMGPTSASSITNSTFFGNTARGNQPTYDDSSGGGAIEFFGSPAILEHNTFVANQALRGTLLIGRSQRGGAVSSSGNSTDLRVQPMTMGHNLLVGNTVTLSDGVTPDTISKFQQVANAAGIELTDGQTDDDYSDVVPVVGIGGSIASNLGIDNGVLLNPAINQADVLGTNPAALIDNRSPATVGDIRWQGDATMRGYLVPQTIAILPNDPPLLVGPADDIAAGSGNLTSDARGFPLNLPAADAGAVQSAWIRFDANGGAWTALPAPHPYDGQRYYDDTAAEVEHLWDYGPIGTTPAIETAPDQAPMPDHLFIGWNTAADGSGQAYPAAGPGPAIPGANLVLYAHWEAPVTTGTVTVEFVDASNATLATSVILTGTIGDPYSATPATVPGYHVVTTPNNVNGVYGGEPITVRYVYGLNAVTPPTPDPGGIALTGTTFSWLALGTAGLMIVAGLLIAWRRGKRTT